MKLTTIETGSGRAAAAELRDGAILDLGRARDALADAGIGTPGLAPLSPALAAILACGELDEVRRLVDTVEDDRDRVRDPLVAAEALYDPGTARLCAPFPEPSLILSQGLSYRAHLAEMDNTPVPDEPTGFIKAASSVIGTGAPILLPPASPDMVDFEGEFSIVIGRPCHDIEPSQAMDYVAGYTMINDVSARDWVAPALDQSQSQMQAALSWAVNLQGKQFPTFTPMGPVMVTADEIPDPHDLRLTTRLNGEVMQDAQTGDLIFPIPRLIAHFSRWYRFRPGDVITTGTPAGVGWGRKPKLFMKDGDLIEITVDAIGTLSNPVRAKA